MKYEAVIFDMDGVIVDTKPTIERFWQELAQSYNFTISPSVMEEYIHGCPTWLTFDKVFPMMNQKAIDDFIEKIHDIEKDIKFNLIAGVYEFLSMLNDAGIAVGLVTSGYQKKVEKVFNDEGLGHLFREIVTAEMVNKGKPDPEPFLLSANKLKVNPGKCLVFEDAISGITAAHSAGMLPIGINSLAMEKKLKSVGAHMVISDFMDVTLEKIDASHQLNINGNKLITL